jgi:hypothetical protein
MELVKGYIAPEDTTTEWISWVYIGISGFMFVVGFIFFAWAYLTHQYRMNFVGFISLIGAGVAAGFAEIAGWWWTIPACAILGGLVWFVTHGNKDFSIVEVIKKKRSKRNGDNQGRPETGQ